VSSESESRARKKVDDRKRRKGFDDEKDEDFEVDEEDEDNMDIDVEGSEKKPPSKSPPKGKKPAVKLPPKKADVFVKPHVKPPKKAIPKVVPKKPTRGRKRKRKSDDSSEEGDWDENENEEEEEIDVSPKKDTDHIVPSQKEKDSFQLNHTKPINPKEDEEEEDDEAEEEEEGDVHLDLSIKKKLDLEPLIIPTSSTDFLATPIRRVTRYVKELDESGSIDVDGSFEPVEYTPMATPNLTPMLTPTSGPPSPFKARTQQNRESQRRLSEKLLEGLKSVKTEKKPQVEVEAETIQVDVLQLKVSGPVEESESGVDLDDEDVIEVS
jgi:hypothetical protein